MADFENLGPSGGLGIAEVSDVSDKIASYEPLPATGEPTRLAPDRGENVVRNIGFALAGTATSLVDTVGSSIGILEENQVTEFIRSSGLEEFGTFYDTNREGLDLASSVVGAITVGGLAVKALSTAQNAVKLGRLGEQLKNSTALRTVLGTGTTYTQRMETVRSAAVAARQTSGIFAGKDLSSTLVRVGGKTLGRVKSENVLSAALEGARQGVAAELAIYGLMNQSQTLYPDEFSTADHLAWASLGVVLPASLEALVARRGVRNTIQGVFRETNPTLGDLGVGIGSFDDVTFRPQNRGVGLSIYAEQKVGTKLALDETTDSTLTRHLNTDITQMDSVIHSQIKNLGTDTNLVMSSRAALSTNEIQHVAATLDDESTALLNTIKIDSLTDDFDDFIKPIHAKLANESEKLDVMYTDMIAQLSASGKDELPLEVMREFVAKRREIDLFNRATYTVLENSGEYSLYSARTKRFLDSHTFADIKTRKTAAGVQHKISIPDGRQIGMDDAFIPIVPPMQQAANDPLLKAINKANLTEEVSFGGQQKEAVLAVSDIITQAFQRDEGMGKRYLDAMAADSRILLNKWTSGGMERLRSMVAEGDPNGVVTEIYRATGEIREALRELAYVEKHGTVPLYRGMSRKEFSGTGPDIASFTTDPAIARKFAGPSGVVIRKDVLVDDIVAVAGYQGEREFIVRNVHVRRYDVDEPLGQAHSAVQSTKVADLSPYEMTGLYAVASKAVENYKPGSGKHKFVKGSPWLTHETQLEILKRHPDAAGDFTLGKGYDSLEDVEFDVLAGKFEVFNQMMDERDAVKKSLGAFSGEKISREDILIALNLPGDSAPGLPHPVVELFENLRLQGDRDLRMAVTNAFQGGRPEVSGMTILRAMMQAHLDFSSGRLRPQDLQEMSHYALRGNMLRQKDVRPLVMQNVPVHETTHGQEELLHTATLQRAQQLQALTEASKNGHVLIGSSVDSIINTQLFDVARRVGELSPEGTLSGRGIFVQQARIEDQDAVLKAASDLVQFSERANKPVIEALMQPLVDNLTVLRSGKNRAELLDFNRVEQAYRYGWDIAAIKKLDDPDLAVTIPENAKNRYGFLLKNTTQNRQLWDNLYEGRVPFPENKSVLMPGMTKSELENGYVPLHVSERAATSAQQISDISRHIGAEVNFLREKQGMNPVQLRDFHLPSPELSKENLWIVYNERGKAVATFSGTTPNAGKAQAQKFIEEQASKNGRVLRTHSWDEVQHYHGIYNDDFQQFIDYSDQINQSGARISGKLFNPELDNGDGTLNLMVGTLSDNMTRLTNRARAALFEPQINQARLMHQANARASNEMSIWERYVNTIYGGQAQTPRSAVGSVYRSVETVFDQALNSMVDRYGITAGAQSNDDFKSMAQKSVLNYSAKEYEQYKAQVPDLDIFGSAEKYLRDTHKIVTPPSLRKLLRDANSVSGTLMYRFLDAGSALLNLSSVMTNAAPVIRATRRLKGESLDDYARRTGIYTSEVATGHRTLNPVKALTTTLHKWQTPEFQQVLKEAEAMGMFQPEFVAMNRILNEPMETIASSKLRRFTDAASWLADNSEMLSRKLSWGLGYNIATDMHGMQRKDAMLFALRFENEMIGDYRPQNRPQIFQGAIGLPLGMFQTYMFNYYRRMFGYLERKDLSSLASQYASQASIFGLSSVPGWDVFSEFFYNNYDGSVNPVDAIQTNFDSDFADLVLYGSMSSIPKLMGLGDGMSFYTRGNANFSAPPTPFTPERAPIWNFASTIMEGSRKTIDQFKMGGQFTPEQTAEILATFSVNRPIQGLIELGLGYETDRRGQIIEHNTRDTLGVVARLFSTNKLATQKTKEVMWRIRGQELAQREVRTRLRDSVRAMVRSGSMSGDNLRQALVDYVKSGGNPEYFPQFMLENGLAATHMKGGRMLLDFIQSEDYRNISRLMATMGPDLANGEFSDD